MELLPTATAKMGWIEALFFINGVEDLTAEGHISMPFWAQGHVQASGPRNKLVQLECKERRMFLTTRNTVFFCNAVANQRFTQSRGAEFDRQTRILREGIGRIFQRDRFCPLWLGFHILKADFGLYPDGERVIEEVAVF